MVENHDRDGCLDSRKTTEKIIRRRELCYNEDDMRGAMFVSDRISFIKNRDKVILDDINQGKRDP